MRDNNPVTLVRDAIHNPAETRHFMQIVPAGRTVQASVGGVPIATSDRAVVVKEVGRDIYDPVIYFPRDDVDPTALEHTEHTTHCPLKGDTEYFHVNTADSRSELAAWSYVDTIPEAAELAGLIAFDARSVQVT